MNIEYIMISLQSYTAILILDVRGFTNIFYNGNFKN